MVYVLHNNVAAHPWQHAEPPGHTAFKYPVPIIIACGTI